MINKEWPGVRPPTFQHDDQGNVIKVYYEDRGPGES